VPSDFVRCSSRSSRWILSLRDVQRQLRAPAWSRGRHDVSQVRSHEVRSVHARGSRQCRLFGRRSAAAGSQVFRSRDVPRDYSRRRSAQRASVSPRTDAVLRSQLLLPAGWILTSVLPNIVNNLVYLVLPATKRVNTCLSFEGQSIIDNRMTLILIKSVFLSLVYRHRV